MTGVQTCALPISNNFNRVLDADLDTYSKDNTWYASAFFAKSFDDFTKTQNTTGGSFVQYNKRHINVIAGNSMVGKNFNAEAGYVPSHGVYPGQINYFMTTTLKFYPGKNIVYTGPQFSVFQTYIPGNILTDKQYSQNSSLRPMAPSRH